MRLKPFIPVAFLVHSYHDTLDSTCTHQFMADRD